MREEARVPSPSCASGLLVLSLLSISCLLQTPRVDGAAVEDTKFTAPRFEAALQNHTRQWLADGHTNNWAVLVRYNKL